MGTKAALAIMRSRSTFLTCRCSHVLALLWTVTGKHVEANKTGTLIILLPFGLFFYVLLEIRRLFSISFFNLLHFLLPESSLLEAAVPPLCDCQKWCSSRIRFLQPISLPFPQLLVFLSFSPISSLLLLIHCFSLLPSHLIVGQLLQTPPFSPLLPSHACSLIL